RTRADGPARAGQGHRKRLLLRLRHPVRRRHATMSEFLSQEEVDALLKGVSGEVDETPEETPTDGPRPYNLATQERIVRGRMPTLEIINDRFARLTRHGLFNFMRRNPDVSVGPVKVQKYNEFIRNLVVPTNINIMQLKPLRGSCLMVF